MASLHGHLNNNAKSCPASPAYHHTHLDRWQRQRDQLHPWTGQRSSQEKIAGHYHHQLCIRLLDHRSMALIPEYVSNQNAAKVGLSQKKIN